MTRVLLIADAGWPTGFERVARGIGSYLTTVGMEVVQYGLGYRTPDLSRVEPYPYEVRPVVTVAADPMGVMQVPTWLEDTKPDAVLMIQDMWNQVNYLSYMPRDLPTVGYYPIDTPNLKWNYAIGAAALTEAVPYTMFGAQETALGLRAAVDVIAESRPDAGTHQLTWLTLPHDRMQLHMRADRLAARQNVEAYRPVPHAINPELFYPMDRKDARHAFGLPDDAFVVLSVGTNQFRKRQDLTMRAFAKFAQEAPDALLVLHCAGAADRQGWDLPQLAQLYGISDRVVAVHMVKPELSNFELNLLYNTANVHINTSGGEGWGLCSVDSALCAIPQLAPDWSATREIWKDVGMLLPVSDYRMETKYLNTAHAIVDVPQTVNRLRYLYEHREVAQAIGKACRQRALALPTWDQVGAQFAERIAAAMQDTAGPASTLDEMRAMRTGTLQSELSLFDS